MVVTVKNGNYGGNDNNKDETMIIDIISDSEDFTMSTPIPTTTIINVHESDLIKIQKVTERTQQREQYKTQGRSFIPVVMTGEFVVKPVGADKRQVNNLIAKESTNS